MADVKISGLPPDTTPQMTDLIAIVDRTTNTTKYLQIQYLGTLFATLMQNQTLTNTEVQKRVHAITSIASVTPNADTDDLVTISAQAQNLSLATPSGTPAEGQTLLIRIKDNGTSYALSYTAAYRAVGVTLPTATLGSSKVLYLGMVYNAQDGVWDVLSIGRQA